MFKNFYVDMGDRSKGLTLERIDNNGGYSPENCCWATRYKQSRNKRNNRMINYHGRNQCLSDWAEELKVGRTTLAYRLLKYPPKIAFSI